MKTCYVCGGTKRSKYTGQLCACCHATGVLTDEQFRVKQQVATDLAKRIDAQVQRHAKAIRNLS
jgi:RecJ-like exonuclease